jgi:hypothetical protein
VSNLRKVSPRGPCPKTCPCAVWASIPSCEQRVRCGRVGAAAQVRCVSLEVLYERCAVHGAARCGDAAAPEGGAAKGSCEGHKGTPTGTAAPAPCDVLPRCGQRAAGCSAVRVPCSGRCGFAVAGRWSGALVAERRSAEQAHATRRADGTRVRTACMPLGRVCVRRKVGHVQL